MLNTENHTLMQGLTDIYFLLSNKKDNSLDYILSLGCALEEHVASIQKIIYIKKDKLQTIINAIEDLASFLLEQKIPLVYYQTILRLWTFSDELKSAIIDFYRIALEKQHSLPDKSIEAILQLFIDEPNDVYVAKLLNMLLTRGCINSRHFPPNFIMALESFYSHIIDILSSYDITTYLKVAEQFALLGYFPNNTAFFDYLAKQQYYLNDLVKPFVQRILNLKTPSEKVINSKLIDKIPLTKSHESVNIENYYRLLYEIFMSDIIYQKNPKAFDKFLYLLIVIFNKYSLTLKELNILLPIFQLKPSFSYWLLTLNYIDKDSFFTEIVTNWLTFKMGLSVESSSNISKESQDIKAKIIKILLDEELIAVINSLFENHDQSQPISYEEMYQLLQLLINYKKIGGSLTPLPFKDFPFIKGNNFKKIKTIIKRDEIIAKIKNHVSINQQQHVILITLMEDLLKMGWPTIWCYRLMEKISLIAKSPSQAERFFSDLIECKLDATEENYTSLEIILKQEDWLLNSHQFFKEQKAVQDLGKSNVTAKKALCQEDNELETIKQLKTKIFQFYAEQQQSKLITAIDVLLRRNWPIEWLSKFIDKVSLFAENLSQIKYSLSSLINFNLEAKKENYESLIKIIEENNKDWLVKIQQFVIGKTFKRNQLERSIDELLDVLRKNNKTEVVAIKDIKRNIFQFYDEFERIKNIENFKDWDEQIFHGWTEKTKKELNDENFLAKLPEILAVINHAVEVYSKAKNPPGYTLRNAQILSLIVMLTKAASQDNHGCFAELATGEGKSLVTASISIIEGLHNKKVKIMTTSCLLAKEHTEEFRPLFKLFGLTVGYNDDSSYKGEGIKECYKHDIVYGDISSFQFDIIEKKFFNNLNIMGQHTDATVHIFDEVDQPFVGGRASEVSMLSTPISGAEHLQPVLALIWIRLKKSIKWDNEFCYVKISADKEEKMSFTQFLQSPHRISLKELIKKQIESIVYSSHSYSFDLKEESKVNRLYSPRS